MANSGFYGDDPEPLSPAELAVVENALEMGGGYVLDFSDETFADFIQTNWDVDVSAELYTQHGGSKANRMRRFLRALRPHAQADVIQTFLQYRESDVSRQVWPPFAGDEVARLNAILDRLTGKNKTVSSSIWTGRRTARDHVVRIRRLAPIAMAELDALLAQIETQRFNDALTADAVQCLREIHAAIGKLLVEVDAGRDARGILSLIEQRKATLAKLAAAGAKVTVVAPAMTIGLVHLLSLLTGVAIDSTLVSGVYGAILGYDALTTGADRIAGKRG